MLKTKISKAMSIPEAKLSYAKKLAKSHQKIESTISGIALIRSKNEDKTSEPIKLLEVNSATSASGFFPVTFGPSGDIPFNSTLVELTPNEAKQLEKNNLAGWPKDWEVGAWLFRKAKTSPKKRGTK